MGNKRQSQERIRIVYGPQFSQGGHAWLESLLYNWLSWLKGDVILRASEMAQQIKVLTIKSDELSLSPRTHVVEELTPESCLLIST